MKPEEMRARSGEKVKQVMELAKVLQLRIEARERINEQGFLEKVVFWIDDEQYPVIAPASNAGNADAEGSKVEAPEETEVAVAEPVPEAENV